MLKTKIFICLALIISLTSLADALTIISIQADALVPGQEGDISIEVENTLNEDIEDVSFNLNFNGLPFTPIGSSGHTEEKIDEDEEELFRFRIKAANDIAPGDYQIPYTITFFLQGEDDIKTRTGSIGITIKANSDLSFSLSVENPVIGQQDQITFKIINKGFGDAKFVAIEMLPEGFTLLSDSQVYIGTVDSDDFETATFDVIYRAQNPIFTAQIQYKDFDNKDILQTVNIPIEVYSKEKATELGIIKKSNTPLYIIIAVALILIYILYRTIKRARRLAKSKLEGG